MEVNFHRARATLRGPTGRDLGRDQGVGEVRGNVWGGYTVGPYGARRTDAPCPRAEHVGTQGRACRVRGSLASGCAQVARVGPTRRLRRHTDLSRGVHKQVAWDPQVYRAGYTSRPRGGGYGLTAWEFTGRPRG